MKRLLIVSTWFQILWFAAILGRYDWQSLVLCLVVITLLVSLYKGVIHWSKVALVVTVGVVVDFSNYSMGLFQFEQTQFPLWLFALWLIFAWYAAFLVPLLSQYPLLFVSIVGGIAGTLSYVAGEKLGAVSFGLPIFSMAALLLIEWTLIIVLIIKVYGYEANTNNRNTYRADG